jgi:hypothetical protein
VKVASAIAAVLFAAPLLATEPEVAAPVQPFYELDSSNAESLQYEAARTRALAWLDVAGRSADASLATLAAGAAAQLTVSHFLVAADAAADQQCASIRASFFVLETSPGTIFVCADTRWHVLHESEPVTDMLAQALVHEAAHLAGTRDECAATLLEVEAARSGDGRPNMGNVHRYAAQCEAF